jgi:ribosomal protein S8E
MVMEYINIKMDVNMKDNFIMIKNMVMVHIYGKMVENMKEIGIKENNKEKEYIMNNIMVKGKKDYGKMVNVLSG